ncbi:hypothetical protein ACXYMX_06325 [Sporosarcina sp. CAU 1771]
MINKTFVYTSLFAALTLAFALKFLHYFSFIKWSPVGWSKKWKLFTSDHLMHHLVNWLMLILALSVLFAIIYIVISLLYKIPPSISAIVLGLSFVFIVHWFVDHPENLIALFGSLSIPFLGVSLMIFRFITGTAVYMKETFTETPK